MLSAWLLEMNDLLTVWQDVESIGAGEICAMFGVECSSGDTFNDGTTTYSMVRLRVVKYPSEIPR